MKKIYSIILTTILLTSCSIKRVHPTQKTINSSSNNKFTILSNEGTICLNRESKNSLKVIYLPLNSSCKSSSLYSWKLNDVDIKADASSINIETYSLYKKSNSKITTKDCAGAGIKIKSIHTLSTPLEIKWGNNHIATIKDSIQKSCFKRVGKEIVKLKNFKGTSKNR